MMRLIRIFAVWIVIMLCFIFYAHAADSYFEIDGFAFSVNEAGEATICGYNGSDSDIVIPQKLLRKPVVAIGDHAFYGKEITSVSFEEATQLRSIGNSAFSGCKSLVKLTLPSNIELSYGSFQNCSRLIDLTIADGISEIPEQCFYGCSSIIELHLPASVAEIGIRAFGECTDLRYAYLDTVASVAVNAFEHDDALIVRCSEGAYAAQFAQEAGIGCEYRGSEAYLRGDADGDGEIAVVDATTIQRLLAHLIDDPDGMIAVRGSVSGDEIDIRDVTAVLRYLSKMTDYFRIGDEATVYYPA